MIDNIAPWGVAESVGREISPFLSEEQLHVLQDMVVSCTPEQIEALTLEQPQVTCPVIHTFSRGTYVRELFTPGGGTLLVGHKQRYNQLNIFLRGKVLMFSSEGNVKVLSGPMMFTGGPGRKTGVVLEDMTWLNVYPSDETNIDTLEDTFFEVSETWKNSDRRNTVDTRDHGYEALLKELDMTREQMDAESQDEENQSEQMPYGSYKCGVHRSPIRGRGLMATATIMQNECLGPARVDGTKTPFGRYCNHSDSPNAYPYRSGNSIYLFAKQDITGCYGGTLGEEILIDYREMKKLLTEGT